MFHPALRAIFSAAALIAGLAACGPEGEPLVEGEAAEGRGPAVDDATDPALEEAVLVAPEEAGAPPDDVSSVAQGLSTSDGETRRCGNYSYWARVVWSNHGRRIVIRGVELWQRTLKGAYVRGMDYRVQERTAALTPGIVWWSTGARTTSAGDWGADSDDYNNLGQRLSGYLYDKSERPYIRFEAGKDGDGKASCAWRIYPLERG